MSGGDVRASVIIVNYEGRDDLEDCLPSVCDQTVDDYEVILVDNDSDDDSVAYVREQFPEVRVLANEENRWYPGGNNDGFELARGEYLVVLNPDVAVERDWLEHLLAPLEDDPDVGLTTSRIVRFEDRSRLNTCGNLAHFTGLGFCRGLDASVDAFPDRERVPAVSGSSFAMRREVYDRIGGFDELFQMYYEDLDFSWRARLAGYDIVYVPESVVYHKYDLALPGWKLFNVERNRYLVLAKHLRVRTLVLLLPALLLTEVLVWVWAATSGLAGLKRKAASWAWLVGNRSVVAEKRREVQALRERSDRALLAGMNVGLPLDQLGVPGPVRPVLEPLVRLAYWPWHWLATDRTSA